MTATFLQALQLLSILRPLLSPSSLRMSLSKRHGNFTASFKSRRQACVVLFPIRPFPIPALNLSSVPRKVLGLACGLVFDNGYWVAA
jgi:hypothetical protein